eukprot:CAMPEP_0177634934 /NCGR_PEP_ID=MMETSP0447-20121125/3632_1 /TAXON_ID=0 /ORGANISM="Stygamoeba regulata, Strain BSH-02190019" /LENGTH=1733 /DNA_ID=CAMNT_0019136687 /DNA_START=44 /DNA_END=5243 /DNA_ORIENTATION=+
MAANNIPIRFQELLQLGNCGVNPSAFTFAQTTLQSDKYVCVRESIGEQSQVSIIELENPRQPLKFPVPPTADSAIMHPNSKILALKANTLLQVYHIEKKKKVCEFISPEPIVFWKWLNEDIIGLVSSTAVYHWEAQANTPPQKMFDRLPNLSDSQIINYKADASMKWLAVVGIAQKDNRIVGTMQLYSVDRKVSQAIEGHACCFCSYTMPGASKPATLFAFTNRSPAASKLFILEVGRAEGDTGPAFQKKAVDVGFSPDAVGDFPVSMQVSERYNVIYMITKFGYFHLFDLSSGTTIYTNRISSQTIFVTAPHESTGGIIGVNRQGQVLFVGVNDQTIIPYIMSTLQNLDVAINLASRSGLPGAENLFSQQFENLFMRGDFKAAAKVAAESPGGMLRTMDTIRRFQQLPTQANMPSPLLQYFGVLLEIGKLNGVESVELARPVLQQGRKNLLEKWLAEDKLTCTEELGDLVRQADVSMALQIFFKAEAPHKVVTSLAELGEFEKIMQYCEKSGYQPDWNHLLQNLLMINPQGVLSLTKLLVAAPGGRLVDLPRVVELLIQNNMVQETTSLLLDVLKGNTAEDGPLQTRLLEVNLMHAPQVADAILGREMFTHYNRLRIAQLCEKAGLFQRALEHYTDQKDIQRVMMNTGAINPEFLVSYFSNMSVEDTLECLKELLRSNLRANLQLCVSVAIKYSEQLTVPALIKLFEDFNSPEGVYYYLSQVVNFSDDPEVHFKYIEAACKTGQYGEVERVVRESSVYDAEKVKNFLKEQRLPDQLPFVIVCDRFDFVNEMTHYLYTNQLLKYVEIYVQQVNPGNTPAVIGALLDSDCSEDYIKNLILSVGNMCPVEELVTEVEKRNRLKIIVPFLESRLRDGHNDAPTHNALGKIYIDLNRSPEEFLTTNQFYDSLVVGKYCESRDPHLAFVAYKRGQCDDALVEVTNKNGLYKAQARYVVERQDLELWGTVLSEDNEHRRSLIDQVVQVALPETKNPEEVSVAVKAFMNADLPKELIELLEKIVLESSTFSGNRNLQNLLILTAIKADKSRVMDYINRLDNYVAPDIANIAVGSELYDEAFAIFKKFGHNVQAIQVLIEHLNKMDAAYEFAQKCDDAEVYTKLARAQLDHGMIKEAIESFVKANNSDYYSDVIRLASEAQSYEDLVTYLQMARKKTKNQTIDSELLFALARTNRTNEVEELLNSPNSAQIMQVGDRCYAEGMYEAAKTMFSIINSHSRLASTLIKLNQFSSAVDAARKANSTRTWKEVNQAAVECGEFRLAQICGLHIIVHGDELEELIRAYESRGHHDHLISLLEGGLGLERAHVGMFTELAILYSKYKEEKLMEHLKLFYTRLNIPKVLRVCKDNRQWSELTFLYINYDEYDNAANCMMENSGVAWENVLFKDIIAKVSNVEICYSAIRFYLEEHPMQTGDLLNVLASRVDNARVVAVVEKADRLALIKPYLQSVQEKDNKAVNEALHQLYIEEEDYEALRLSITTYHNFDSIGLAQRLEKHDLLEFRRVAASLYRKNNRWVQSSSLAKTDGLWKDAIETAAESKSNEVCEGLLQYFCDNNRPDCFCACLYTCYDFIRPDVALELAWRSRYTDYVMPYMIQTFRDFTTKLDDLAVKGKAAEEESKKKAEEAVAMSMGVGGVGMMGGMGPMAPRSGFIPAPQSMMNMPTMPMHSMMGMPMPAMAPPMQHQPGLAAAPPARWVSDVRLHAIFCRTRTAALPLPLPAPAPP